MGSSVVTTSVCVYVWSVVLKRHLTADWITYEGGPQPWLQEMVRGEGR